MDKVKLAICMKDQEYQARFVNCFMNHYQYMYEVHAFSSLDELNMSASLAFAVIVSEEYSMKEMTCFVEKGMKLLFLTEEAREKECKSEDFSSEMISYTCKYQEVYKIAEIIQRMTANGNGRLHLQGVKEGNKRTGVFSLSKEKYQIPVVALLAEIYGEQEKVLVLDLQSYSGLVEMENDSMHMGLEDLLSVAMTGNYSKSRVLECIVQRDKWDYIYPVKNVECLAEGKMELYEEILEFMEQDLGYQRILINFGTAFNGQLEMMDHCDFFYLLSGKESSGEWRETSFLDVLERREKKKLRYRLKMIEIPKVPTITVTWENLIEKWRWSDLGESLRSAVRKENEIGRVV